jgi:formamidopyrimidine-DNA glycosylase
MPELPDITVYLEALQARILGQELEKIRLVSPFLLRSVAPPLDEALGRRVIGLRRLGKRIVIELEGGRFLVLHLMIAGRLHWKAPGARIHGKIGLAAFDFPAGSLILTEAGTRKRASLYLVKGEAALAEHDPGGIEVMEADAAAFAAVLRARNHTLKRALTDPRLFSGIGNAYSDESLHRARLSPFALTTQLGDEEVARLHRAVREVLGEWIARLRADAAGEFPEQVTAFREGMAVHGRYNKPCPVCGRPVQRVRYADHSLNYCAQCQTGGRLLADRALSALLKKDWPRTLDELEQLLTGRKEGE